MLRTPVVAIFFNKNFPIRFKSSSCIRKAFIEYFVERGHKHVKSSSVIPHCDPTVPFVNAGMNQFKGVFLGLVDAPCPRAVNSQKCIRVGGKHNDLDVIGLDGHHHTFFEMLGNWSLGDYQKKEACEMAWHLLLGPYGLKPEQLTVTYFEGDAILGLPEDTECRDIWKEIGVNKNHLRKCSAKDNFWEMGLIGPCGPCTEIHYINPDGSLTEIWNIVFIQCNREADGSVRPLRRLYVDTGLGLERLSALLQRVPSNYDTDLFRPIITFIEQNCKNVASYGNSYAPDARLDQEYRRLADHARMISICLADGAFPCVHQNLKQIIRKSFKICTDVFQNPNLMIPLYEQVAATLGEAYPELISREKQAKLIIQQEKEGYKKFKAEQKKKWKEFVKSYPEVEAIGDMDLTWFTIGYTALKEAVSQQNLTKIPGELALTLHRHGFKLENIERVAKVNNLDIDKEGFSKMLTKLKCNQKTAINENVDATGIVFDTMITTLVNKGIVKTDDQAKYDFTHNNNEVYFEPLKTNVVALFNDNVDWVDFLDPCENRMFYVLTEKTNFYCEEGGQGADTGYISFNEKVKMKVDTVFKIRDFVFHKGFILNKSNSNVYVNNGCEVRLEIDGIRRLCMMRNHTATHLVSAALRRALPNTAACSNGAAVTEGGIRLTYSIYGDRISQEAILSAQKLIRESIAANVPVRTQFLDSVQLSSQPDVQTVPGETYPETNLRMVTCGGPLETKELCCGTHVPYTGVIQDVCLYAVKGASSLTPTLYALSGPAAVQASDIIAHTRKLAQEIDQSIYEDVKEKVVTSKQQLRYIFGDNGTPHGEYAECLELLEIAAKKSSNKKNMDLKPMAQEEIKEAMAEADRLGRHFVVHFLRCSYLMQPKMVAKLLASEAPKYPAVLLGCAGGVIMVAAHVPPKMVSPEFTAETWLSCITCVFRAQLRPPRSGSRRHTYAEMTPAKVSLINCEQLVQDAMKVLIQFAQSHLHRGNKEYQDTKKN